MEILSQVINNPVISGPSTSMSSEQFFGKLFAAVISLMFVIGAVIFMFMLVSGGIKWISSGGDKVKLQNAQSTIVHAIVGLVVLLGLYGLVDFLEGFVGFKFTYFDISSLGL